MEAATSYDVRVMKHVRIPMRDGAWLAADLFMPVGEGRFPAVMEYLPYRKDDLTLGRDYPHYYFAARGYIGVRLDARGTGASPGASFDEYTEQEQRDGYDACEWLATQPWSTGAVGAFGTSYGGYTSCQLAANRPPHLKAIAPMYGFDDHYVDDCHYCGGQLRMYDMGRYGNRMLATNALPPPPEIGAAWAAIWRERLEKSDSWLMEWLRHQTDGPYWWTGSIRDRVEEIDCAVLLWGGWRDGYINPILRMFPRLRGPKRAIIGPWMHARPDVAIPGPRIDWLHETVRWWDQWLKGIDTGVMDEPPVTLYMQRFDPPTSDRAFTSGYWRSETTLVPQTDRSSDLYLGPHGRLSSEPEPHAEADSVAYHPAAGLAGGEFSAGGLPGFGLPTDQRRDEIYSLLYTSEPLTEPLEILGNPQVILHASSTARVAVFSAKLCVVAPDGASALICKGALNATRRASLVEPEALEPGEVYALTIPLDATAWRFAAGERIRLMIGNADFPSLWPTPEPARSTVRYGAGHPSRLVLPVAEPVDPSRPVPEFRAPTPPSISLPQLSLSMPFHDDVHHLLEDTVESRSGFVQVAVLPDGVRVVDERRLSSQVSNTCPSTAKASGFTRLTIMRAEWTVDVEAQTIVSSAADALHVTQQLHVHLDGVPFFQRQWIETIPRRLI